MSMSFFLRQLIGTNNYMNTVGYAVRLYKSMFRRIAEPGVGLIAQFVPRGGVMFDIGANIGRFTTFSADLVGPEGTVYSFEPLVYPRRILSDMVKLRRLRQVEVVGAALSDREGEMTMTIPLKPDGKPQPALAYISDDPDARGLHEQVTVYTLDGFCAAHAVERVDFIKCDVEGFEYNVFFGGRQTLERHRPGIYCEINPGFHQRLGGDAARVFKLLGELGYQPYLPGTEGRLAAVADWTRYNDKQDYFFLHTSKYPEAV